MKLIRNKVLLVGVMLLHLNGCSFFISNATEDFGNSLSQVILNHNDPETIVGAIPAYLLILEALVAKDPENGGLLTSTATLYGAYLGLLTDEADRKKQLANKALGFASRAVCTYKELFCQINQKKYQEFESIIQKTEKDDIAVLFSLGSTWALWIQANKDDWTAISQLAQVKLLMTRVTELEPEYKDGEAYIYLGVLATILPPALGGTPEIGKQHFETALQLADQKNLMIKVIYAKQYARMMFDRELHDKLLNAVIQAKIEYPSFTLMNALAQRQAKDLLSSADEYF